MTARTDRELLELAAKAFGYTKTRADERGWFYVCTYPGEPLEWELWEPLAVGDTALELAVKLYLVVAVMRQTHDQPAFTAVYHFNGPEHVSEIHGEDASAATRRAIVRAAAAIGEAMP